MSRPMDPDTLFDGRVGAEFLQELSDAEDSLEQLELKRKALRGGYEETYGDMDGTSPEQIREAVEKEIDAGLKFTPGNPGIGWRLYRNRVRAFMLGVVAPALVFGGIQGARYFSDQAELRELRAEEARIESSIADVYMDAQSQGQELDALLESPVRVMFTSQDSAAFSQGIDRAQENLTTQTAWLDEWTVNGDATDRITSENYLQVGSTLDEADLRSQEISNGLSQASQVTGRLEMINRSSADLEDIWARVQDAELHPRYESTARSAYENGLVAVQNRDLNAIGGSRSTLTQILQSSQRLAELLPQGAGLYGDIFEVTQNPNVRIQAAQLWDTAQQYHGLAEEGQLSDAVAEMRDMYAVLNADCDVNVLGMFWLVPDDRASSERTHFARVGCRDSQGRLVPFKITDNYGSRSGSVVETTQWAEIVTERMYNDIASGDLRGALFAEKNRGELEFDYQLVPESVGRTTPESPNGDLETARAWRRVMAR